jgi:hypothetical protein
MTLVLNGTNGLSDVDGSAATPAIRGTDANTGIFFPAADTIAFSEGGAEVMRIDSSGNLGIGSTSPLQRLDVASSGTGVYQTIRSTSSGSTNVALRIQDGTTGTSNTDGMYLGRTGAVNYLWTYENEPWAFGTNNTERARIDSSGNLLVGVSSAPYHSFQKNNSADWAMAVINSNASVPQGLLIRYTGAAPNGAGSSFLLGFDTIGTRFSFYSNGGLANYSGNNVNLSDRREKTNFAPAGDYLAKICAIPVQTFNYIDQNMEEDDGLTLGVVAQDVQAVAPELVLESNWAGKDEEPKMRLSIYQTDLQYALMKCIQEQQALIITLTDRITALEAKP